MGAIVGGGILALAGTAFAVTGPSAVLAFVFNGLIALLTALTFAEMATSFPGEMGGTSPASSIRRHPAFAMSSEWAASSFSKRPLMTFSLPSNSASGPPSCRLLKGGS